MFEPTAVFAVGEFAGAVGDRRRSEDRKSVVPALEFFSSCSLNDKQEFLKIFVNYHFFPIQGSSLKQNLLIYNCSGSSYISEPSLNFYLYVKYQLLSRRMIL